MAEAIPQAISDRQDEAKAAFIEALNKYPNISWAAHEAGIDRSTFYRWQKEDTLFSDQIKIAIRIGKAKANDKANGTILTGVYNGDIVCTKYWLKHNHPDYITEPKSPSTSQAVNNMEMPEEFLDFFRLPGTYKEKEKEIIW